MSMLGMLFSLLLFEVGRVVVNRRGCSCDGRAWLIDNCANGAGRVGRTGRRWKSVDVRRAAIVVRSAVDSALS